MFFANVQISKDFTILAKSYESFRISFTPCAPFRFFHNQSLSFYKVVYSKEDSISLKVIVTYSLFEPRKTTT